MLGGIKTALLLVNWDAELSKEFEDEEEGSHICSAPSKDHENSNNLAAKEHSSTIIEKTPVGNTAIGLVDIVHLGEETSEEETSCTTSHMHRRG